MEALGAVDPTLPEVIRAFAEAAAEHGVFLEPASRSLMVKWHGPDEKDYALGGFSVNGFISYSVNYVPNTIGRIDLAHDYLEELARLVGGAVRQTAAPDQWYVVRQGSITVPTAMEVLARQVEWLKLIENYTRRLKEAIESRG